MRAALLLTVLLLCGCMSAPQTACPKDAKLCPDGSAVARTPPDCDFQPCPAAQSTSTTQQPKALKALSLSTERPLYHSMETMWINLTLESDAGGLAEVWVHGINSRGRERLTLRSNHTLKQGVNNIALKYQTPPCTGCAGINPGKYTVSAEVTLAGKTTTYNTTVEIQQ